MADIPESTKRRAAFALAASKIDRDARLSDLTDAEIDALIASTRAAPPAMDREAVEKIEGLNPHVAARIKHVLQTVANYADAERNGGEFADDLRRDIACMNGDVVADDLAQFTAALSTLSADAIRQGEGGASEVPKGMTRAYVRCRAHDRVTHYDYVPYSFSTAVGVMPCGCDLKHAAQINREQFLAASNGGKA